MAGRLITLPLRASLRSAQISLRSAQLMTRAAGGVAGRALSIGEQAIGLVSPGRFDRARGNGAGAAPASAETTMPPPRVDRSPVDRPPVDRAPASPPAPPARRAEPIAPPPEPTVRLGARTVPPAEPTHVSEEPELVEASAEPGAEDGAGADITVIEPWNGYRKMSARDVIDRASHASPAELAAIGLYEARHRARQTVLAAVDRQLKLANGSRPA